MSAAATMYAGPMARLRRLAAGILLFAAAVIAGTASGCGPGDPSGPFTSPCPPGKTCQTRLTILHTSDIHSRLYPYEQLITQIDSGLGLGALNTIQNIGGVARMSYVIKRERARAERVLHLDSGDCFQGAPIFNFYYGEPEVRSLSAMGCDAAVIGNHEFDRGALNVTQQFQRWGNFRSLAANYLFDDPILPASPKLSSISSPFAVFNREGLKVGVIGMANLSSLTSVFEQPNRLGITPLNTVETAQGYVDLLRPYVDVIIMVTHLGLEVDQRMVRGTTGIDLVLGGHNHVVINPPQLIEDCHADSNHPGFVWAVDPKLTVEQGDKAPDDADPALAGPEGDLDPVDHPFMVKRGCKPRKVIIAHSGSFAKYVGRLDLTLSNDPADVTEMLSSGNPADYDPINKFEIVSHKYVPYPIDKTIPEDPVMVDMLTPYARTMDLVADLDLLVGYAPQAARRSAPNGGDSPLGNMVAQSIWLRLGIQTDFSLTNTTGVRSDLNPGPVSLEQMFNIFPFDNTIGKMQLSGIEVQEMFDFVARRSASRGCTSQVQIAGARIRVNCSGCTTHTGPVCKTNEDCITGTDGICHEDTHTCKLVSCADHVYIGHRDPAVPCTKDEECAEPGQPPLPGSCDVRGAHRCLSLIKPTNLYELGTSTYLAQGGSGFRVLQRNTTQLDTKVQQRDALIDYMRQQKPCGWKPADPATGRPAGLQICATDNDCAPGYACACGKNGEARVSGGTEICVSNGTTCNAESGRCVLKACRNDVAAFHNKMCETSPERAACKVDLNACSLAGEECKLLSCIDQAAGAITDDRVEMIGR
jgi:5'-nucleotidase/UDP-sugar diphosphatase